MRRNILNILKLKLLLLMTFSAFGQSNSNVFFKPGTDPGAVETCPYTLESDLNFTIPIYFKNLEWENVYDPITEESEKQALLPCDLFVGVTFADYSPIYSSAITDILYKNDYDIDGDQIWVGNIPFKVSEDFLLEYFSKWPCVGGANLPLEVGLFCKENGSFSPVDYCEDYDLWAPIIWNLEVPDPDNCTTTYETCMFTDCISAPSITEHNENISSLDKQELLIESFDNHLVISSNKNTNPNPNIIYMIHDLRGNILKNKNVGLIENGSVIVEYDNLPAGMYIFTTNINGSIQSKKIVKF